MARETVPNFAGGPNENGSEWLDTLEAHFMDREWEGEEHNNKRCKYFKLHLRGEARRRYDDLPDDVKNNWDHLYTKWSEWYPRTVTVPHEQSYLQQFRAMRLDVTKLAKPIVKEDGSVTWETVKFVERVRHCANGITLLTDEAKGVDTYSSLPPVVKDQLPKYPGLGPSLSILSLDLLALNHYEIASRVQQSLAIQDQLNSISQSLSRTSFPRTQGLNNTPSSNTSNTHAPNSAAIYPSRYSARIKASRGDHPDSLRTSCSNSSYSNADRFSSVHCRAPQLLASVPNRSISPYDPVPLFQTQVIELAKRVRRTGVLIPEHQRLKIIHTYNERENSERFKIPFITPADITGLQTIRVRATVDNGSGLCAIDANLWAQWHALIGNTAPSHIGARMASGHIVRSAGSILLHTNVAGIATTILFEILDSRGAFEVLLGKLWLAQTYSRRNYDNDTLDFRVGGHKISISNRSSRMLNTNPPPIPATPPPDAVPTGTATTNPITSAIPSGTVRNDSATTPPRPSPPMTHTPHRPTDPQTCETTTNSDTTEEGESSAVVPCLAIDPDLAPYAGRGIYDNDRLRERKATHTLIQSVRPVTSRNHLFNPERIKSIQDAVEIGSDCTPEQRQRALDLVAEFADAFALTLSEVRPNRHVEHRIEIPPDVKLPRYTKSPPLTPPQREWLHKQVDNLLEAGIITRIAYDDVKCLNSIVLAPKPNKESQYSLEDLRILANAACIKAGVPIPHPNSPSDPSLIPPPPETSKDSWRLCNNFAALNRVTKVPSFPTGDLASKQSKMSGFSWYVGIDLAAAYHACPIRKSDWAYTAFRVEDRGIYAWVRTPFGLTGAGNTANEMIEIALKEQIGKDLESLMDDVCEANDDWDKLFVTLRRTLELCRENELMIAPSKMKLFVRELLWGGVVLSKAGVSLDPSKVATILQWQTPSTALGTLSFLSSASFFRPSIHNFAITAEPLYELVRGIDREKTPHGVKNHSKSYKTALTNTLITEKWSNRHDHAFALLKAGLTTAPARRPPKYDREFIVGADACKDGYSAFLCQWHEDPQPGGTSKRALHAVAFASRRTHPTERHAHSFVLELAGLKFALEQFNKFIAGCPIILATDCQSAKDLLENASLPAAHMRYKEFILSFNIVDFIHLPGPKNPADSISRWAVLSDPMPDKPLNPGWEESEGLVNDLYHCTPVCTLLLQPENNPASLTARFEDDPRLPIVKWLTDITLHANMSGKERKDAITQARSYFIENGRLWRMRPGYSSKVECITHDEGYRIMRKYHEETHWGRDLMLGELRPRYEWPNMSNDAATIPSKCLRCQAFGPQFINFLLKPIITVRPFDMIAADYLKLPPGEKRFSEVLLFIDYMTRFAWAFPLKRAGTSTSSAEALEFICRNFNPPSMFLTDNGPHFKGVELETVCSKYGINHQTTLAYSPHCNGLIEKECGLILRTLSRLCNPGPSPTGTTPISTKWPSFLPEAVSIVNNRITAVLGTSPRKVMFGLIDDTFDIDDSMELDPDTAIRFTRLESTRDAAIDNMLNTQAKRATYFNRRAHAVMFEKGDLVLVHNTRFFNKNNREAKLKLSSPWFGPLIIHERHHNSYSLRTLAGNLPMGRVHANRLKKFLFEDGSPEAERLTRQAREAERDILATLDAIQDDPDPDPDPTPFVRPAEPPPNPTQHPPTPANLPPSDKDSDPGAEPERRTPRRAALNHAFIRPR